MSQQQTQKELAKLMQFILDLAKSFGGFLQKDHGKGVVKLNPEEMAEFRQNVSGLAEEQKALAKDKYGENGTHPNSAKALYLNTRAAVMDQIAEEMRPENLETLAANPMNLSQEQMQANFEAKLAERIENDLGTDIAKNNASIEMRKMKPDDLQKLDQELVENRFNPGSPKDKMILSGLAVGSHMIKNSVDELENESISKAKKEAFEPKLENDDGTKYEKTEKPERDHPGPNPNQDRGLSSGPKQ